MSEKAGIADPTSKSLGVAVLDYDGDGWPDIFVANDTTPNRLYRNNRNGTFTEEGVAAGVAYSEDGVARGAMGVDAGDYDGSGRPHLLVGNFSNQMLALYHNEGGNCSSTRRRHRRSVEPACCTLAFGVFFFDYDLDGHLDIFAANGHIEEAITKVQPKVQYKEPPLCSATPGNGTFENVERLARSGLRGAGGRARRGVRRLRSRRRSRHPDPNNHGPARLLQNDGGNRNRWITIRTVGAKSNRDGIGADRPRAERRQASSGAWSGAARATRRRATWRRPSASGRTRCAGDRRGVAERREGSRRQREAESDRRHRGRQGAALRRRRLARLETVGLFRLRAARLRRSAPKLKP